jgi:hypothetical protein
MKAGLVNNFKTRALKQHLEVGNNSSFFLHRGGKPLAFLRKLTRHWSNLKEFRYKIAFLRQIPHSAFCNGPEVNISTNQH